MTVKRITLAVLTAMALAPALGTSAGAQYYQDDYGYRPRRPPPPDHYDDRPRYGYGRRYRDEYDDGPRRFGRICITARGNCPARPAPFNTPCGCEIPGFGLKRGAIGG